VTPVNSNKRKSVVILLQILLNSLLKWFAPILSFTTEEIFRLISKNQKSIHLEKFIQFPKKFNNPELNKKWNKLNKNKRYL
jgi:isoleucyl-tRNA synthetase